MEPLQILQDFYLATSSDMRITNTHIAVYAALIYVWTTNKCYPIQITRKQIMQLAKINGVATYHKCIKELQLYDYIKYEPSFNPKGASSVTLVIYER